MGIFSKKIKWSQEFVDSLDYCGWNKLSSDEKREYFNRNIKNKRTFDCKGVVDNLEFWDNEEYKWQVATHRASDYFNAWTTFYRIKPKEIPHGGYSLECWDKLPGHEKEWYLNIHLELNSSTS